MPRFFPVPALLLSTSALWLTSCKKAEIRVYTAPKDPPPVAQQNPSETPPAVPRGKPKVTWTLPADWKAAPATSELSVGNFLVKTDAGEATVNITPLGNLQGQEEMVVNMYRQQAGLGPVEGGDPGTLFKPVEVAGAQGKLLELAGNTKGKQVRILTAIAHRDDRSWFYRIAGDDAVVLAQKGVFLDFIKSVRIEESAMAAPAAPDDHAGHAHAAESSWPLPPGWTQLAPGPMQIAKFSVPEQAGAKAEATVSVFPSDTGGTLSNVNRWRQQLGLQAVDQAGLAALTTPLDPTLPDALLITLNNAPRGLLGAIVPRQGQWFFYKLMGDASAVTAAREAFVTFAKAVPPGR